MRNTEHSLDTLAFEKLAKFVNHGLEGERGQVGRVVRPAIAEQVWCDDPVSLTREVVDLVPPVEGRRGVAMEKQKIRLFVATRFLERISIRGARRELDAPHQVHVTGVKDVGLVLSLISGRAK